MEELSGRSQGRKRAAPWLLCENYAKGRNHRTEATEVTEGENWG